MPEAAAIPEDQLLRVCSRCGRPRRLKHFRFRRKATGQRHTECNTCHSGAKQRRRARQRELEISRYASAINRTNDPAKLIAIANALSVRFCGPEGVAKAFYIAIENARKGKRDATALRGMIAIVNLIVAGENQEKEQCSRMDSEMLKRRHRDAVVDLVESTPEHAISALLARGYRVIPPKED